MHMLPPVGHCASPQVSIVPDTGYRAEESVSANNALVSAVRTVYDRRGIRIVVSQGGRIGAFAFQVMLNAGCR